MHSPETTVQYFRGFTCQGHYFDVPLDYENPDSQRIKVFAREVVSNETKEKKLPWLVFLQGGPGFASPRPESMDGWLKRALRDHRVLLLDQRGTGLSTPVTHETMELFPSPEAQADYLKNFRADSIVRDCEVIRGVIAEGAPWAVLGQSYGGFCITTYLSFAPDGLSKAIILGGLPPLVNNPDEVYKATYRRVIDKNNRYYQRFPGDGPAIEKVVNHLRSHHIELPTTEVLSARRFLQLGIAFGFNSAGGNMNAIHYLLEGAFVANSEKDKLSYSFLRNVERMMSYNSNPIYSLLHESIYCQGNASNWSADRMLHQFPEFNSDHRPTFFTGEMIYPWMFDEYECLKPMKEAAQLLATYDKWPKLYDVGVLRKNTVPCVATIYYNDMYVDRKFAEETADNIHGIKIWITNEYEHDAIRQDGERVLDRCLSILSDPTS
ncbi:MAG: alpha/beta fold hydrolase [Cyanobacteria bacterium SZAS-4]|nr:alpha/beta fold hydrolase [Cyanobacteria bacterium SZAS-4]